MDLGRDKYRDSMHFCREDKMKKITHDALPADINFSTIISRSDTMSGENVLKELSDYAR